MIKPTVIFILVITIAGHIYRKTNYKLYPKYDSSNGYHTFLLAASTGLVLFICSYIFTNIIARFSFFQSVGVLFSNHLNVLTPSIGQDHETVNLISVLIFTVIISWFIPMLKYEIAKKRQENPTFNSWKKAARKDLTPEFTHLAFNSWEYGLPIAFTLSNNKVYVGYISEIGIDSNDIHLLPILSGYRCDKKKDLIYLIDYKPVIEHILNEEYETNGENTEIKSKMSVYKKFAIAIPHREVIHANLHDTSYKKHFDRHRYDRKETKPSDVKFTLSDL
ncbi:hypothetical protein QL989_17875 [Pseudoalteromonas sp. APC 3224]|jgi:hypothetical protein|uniref:hypothetical protein n=1 Tax=Pseudoalteromonas sp. APC 3224 TaxID=3035203 RepID=UPI0025B3B22B|nr:hypothetical protein [Pseudoalteromonas sp. APC 3224]MDN3487211.1 hypothetical protein [Pseudoalteromonas sp. APC 3224]|tara:strand:+ start:1076 stop:1906 length:831 start_codon:yes stop_codon:yes gene_type:complete